MCYSNYEGCDFLVTSEKMRWWEEEAQTAVVKKR